jgi:CBS domain-containing protein
MAVTSLGTLVTYNPWSVGATALLEEVAARFDELHIHHVPVVNDQRQVIGMLSETDLLRARQQQREVLVGAGPVDTVDLPIVFARDCMTRDVLFVSPGSSFGEALGLLLKRQIHALPVVEEGRLVGVISSRDFLREFSYGEMDCARDPISSLLRARGPEPLEPDATLDDALMAMHEAGINCLAVAQGNCPLGLVSQRDIVREKCRLQRDEAAPDGRAPTILRVTRNSPAIRSGQRLCEAAAAMVDHNLPAVTVVNQSNRLLGLVSEDDLLRVLYDAQA